MAFKQYILKILRKRVLSEVEELHKKALLAKDGNQAAKHHAAAGQVIALFPLSDDKTVLDQARKLTTKQTNLATQIQVLRRQRYNLWAVGQIEKAINGYYENSRTFSPVGENAGLVKSCVEQLSMVDPALLEPSTLELYTYALNLTNQAIREGDKVTLAKGLANPKVKRKSLGDF